MKFSIALSLPFLVSCSLSAHRTSVAAHVSRLIVSRFQLWGRSLPGAWAGEAAGYRVPVFLPGGGLYRDARYGS